MPLILSLARVFEYTVEECVASSHTLLAQALRDELTLILLCIHERSNISQSSSSFDALDDLDLNATFAHDLARANRDWTISGQHARANVILAWVMTRARLQQDSFEMNLTWQEMEKMQAGF